MREDFFAQRTRRSAEKCQEEKSEVNFISADSAPPREFLELYIFGKIGQGNLCQRNGRKSLQIYSPDKHCPDFPSALVLSRFGCGLPRSAFSVARASRNKLDGGAQWPVT